MFSKNNIKNNKKGQIFVISVVIAVTIALISSYILLESVFKAKSPGEFLGSYQSGIIDAISDGNKVELYVDEASKIAVSKAWDEYIYAVPPMLEEEYASEYTASDCGNYVYNLWNNESKDCYPNYLDSQNFKLNYLINKNLDELTKSKESGKNINLDRILTQSVNYDYSYSVDDTTHITHIYGQANSKYDITIFRDLETRNNEDVQKYLQDKNTYSGDFIWPLENNYDVSSCFGYRGTGTGGSTNHPGLDITAPLDTPVLAAADGTIEEVLYPRWGKVVINHGGGIETGYLHMNKIAVGLKKGDTVKQGDIIGYVGGRGANTDHEYPIHLHFEMISTNVDPKAAYEDISAVVSAKYVNPMCFIEQTKQPIIFNMQSKACNSICDETKCAALDSTDTDTAPYKFCSVYNDIIVKDASCLKVKDTDWKINSVRLSSTTLTSDQTLKITMNVENNGDTCVNIKPKIVVRNAELNLHSPANKQIFIGKNINIYKSTEYIKETTFTALTCTFTSDEELMKKETAAGNCVILLPADQTEVKYNIYSEATDFNDKNIKPDKSYEQITVKKVTSTETTSDTEDNTAQNNNVELTKEELATINTIKKRLIDLGVWDYIDTLSQKYDVPRELILAKITRESSGINYKIDIPKNYAIGISQVEGWQHYDTIEEVCGQEYVSECNSCGATSNFKNCCKFEKFGSDPKCQLDVGVKLLKEEYYDKYNSNDKAYTSAVNGACKNQEYQQLYLSYTGWERAFRAYNGFGCSKEVYTQYVGAIMNYARMWGYSSQTDSVVHEEIKQGIFGKYTITSVFNINMDFDVRLFDTLRDFANNTVITCSKEGQDKNKCVDTSVKVFNTDLDQKYKDKKVTLTADCDESDIQTEVNKLIEEINNCVSSTDTDCQCVLSHDTSYTSLAEVNSLAQGTTFTYFDNEKKLQAHLDGSVAVLDSFWQQEDVKIDNINIYKDKDTSLRLGKAENAKFCEPIKNKFRFCLKTDYDYSLYDPVNKEIIYKKIKIPFAITVRDTIPPKPVTGITADNMLHDTNSIILLWDRNSEVDVVKYNIYLSENKEQFISDPIKIFKDSLDVKTISLDAKQKYLEYKEITLPTAPPAKDYPLCKLTLENGVDKCIFEYSATTKDDTVASIKLNKNTLYYISSTNKFMYILDGSDSNNGLTKDVEKGIVITAIDIDGNEIDNKDEKQKITEGSNMITIAPKDNLEKGFVKIKDINVDANNQMSVSWEDLTHNIDGTIILDGSNINYNVRLIKMDTCPTELYSLEGIEPKAACQYNSFGGCILDVSDNDPGTYCVAISAGINDYNNPFSNNGILVYNYAFLKETTIPPKANP